MNVKVFVPLNVDDLIRDTEFPVNGGERFQIILILSLIEIGCNVWISWEREIPHEDIDKKFFDKKGDINFMSNLIVYLASFNSLLLSFIFCPWSCFASM